MTTSNHPTVTTTMERLALELLAAEDEPVGAIRLAATWRASGIVRGEATAGRFLRKLDDLELTASAGSTHGRTLTAKGVDHLRRLQIDERQRAREDALTQALTVTDTSDVTDLLLVRKLVEAECAAMAAIRATDEERAEILREARGHTSIDPSTTDTSVPSMTFHRLIAEASHNRPLQAIAHMLLDPANDPLERLLSQISANLGDTMHQLNDHVLVAEAIDDRDPNAARETMRHHVDRLLTAVQQFTRSEPRAVE